MFASKFVAVNRDFARIFLLPSRKAAICKPENAKFMDVALHLATVINKFMSEMAKHDAIIFFQFTFRISLLS